MTAARFFCHTGFITTLLLTLSLLMWVSCASGEKPRLVELLNIEGCQKTSEHARETTHCFAGNESMLELTLHGENFPEIHGNARSLRVILREATQSSLLWAASHEPDPQSSHETAESSLLTLECQELKTSEQFPRQLLKCRVDNPLVVLERYHQLDPEVLREKQKHLGASPVWMDAHLEALSEDSVYTPLSILRRALEIDMRSVLHSKRPSSNERETELNETEEKKEEAASRARLLEHPLERLYGSSRETAEDDLFWLELGIGGLKSQLRSLFRRVFLSRLPSISPIAKSIALQHVRGVILYGPPGNGKTLVARSFHRLLGDKSRLTFVNAPDILSKYVGDSEKNLRDVFEGLEAGTSAGEDGHGPRKSKGTAAADRDVLQVLVIDEFDSLFHNRGTSDDGSAAKAVYDGVTNTLLSLMDGLEARNNLLVIGLTNRLSAVDPALLRPGRFEVIMQVPAPDLAAREDILFIHTQKLRQQHFLDPRVDLREFARLTDGFSGADISGAVRAALSYSLLRHREEVRALEAAPTPSDGNDTKAANFTFMVQAQDLRRAVLDISRTRQKTTSSSGIRQLFEIPKQNSFFFLNELIHRVVSQVHEAARSVLSSNLRSASIVLLSADVGNGKTELAQYLTHSLKNFTTVRFISCRHLLNNEKRLEEGLRSLKESLYEAVRTESGLVVLDDLDALLEGMSGRPQDLTQLRFWLHAFVHHPEDLYDGNDAEEGSEKVPRSLLDYSAGSGEPSNASSTNKRILIITTTRSSLDSLQRLDYDLSVRLPLLDATQLQELLVHYHVVAPEAPAQPLMQMYRAPMSFRNFIRATDITVNRYCGARQLTKPAFFTASGKEREHAAQEQNTSTFYLLRSPEEVQNFSENLHYVEDSLGLTSPEEWFRVDEGTELIW